MFANLKTLVPCTCHELGAVVCVMADEESEAETIPGALDESVPASSTQLARRSYGKRQKVAELALAMGTGPGQPKVPTPAASHEDGQCTGHRCAYRVQNVDRTGTTNSVHPSRRSQGRPLIHDVQLLHNGPHFRADPSPLAAHAGWRVPPWPKELMEPTCFGEAGTVGTSSLGS